MIDLTTKAENYAAANSNDIITKAIAKAYAEGYRDGYKDREEEIVVNLNYSDTEFVDLGLPSGTCWSVDYERENKKVLYASYEQVAQLSLPSTEQVQELFDSCIWELYDRTWFICIGPNKNSISFKFSAHKIPKPVDSIKDSYWHANFWIKKPDEPIEKQSASLFLDHDQLKRRLIIKELKHFIHAYMLPVRLVMNKK